VLDAARSLKELDVNSSTPDGWLLRAVRIVARGFLLGAGFSVALGIAYYMAWHWTTKNAHAEIADFSHETAKDIVLSDVEEQKHDGTTTIIGKATNSGKTPARGLHIQANLFNHGKFVDQYSTYLTGSLAAGNSQFFKISCGCKDTPPAEHDSYKLEVLNGF
jgi:hypothetical protein